jgi:phosphoribosylformimino-5-aminoimidazole carboxamide ribotide isomerase
MKAIPAIDIKDGQCVRLHQGRFDRVTDYPYTPEGLADRYRALGARRLHLVDLDGARTGGAGNRALIEGLLRRHPGRFQVGGGIRDLETAASLLEAGAGRVVLGSAAAESPDRVFEWIDALGEDRVVVALDVSGDPAAPQVMIQGWAKASAFTLWDALDRYADAGLRHVLCTDISRDGAMQGPAVELYRRCLERCPGLQLQASGGVRNAADLAALTAAGLPAAIVGRALLEGAISDEEIQPYLRNA